MSYRHALLAGSCPYCHAVLSLPWELGWIVEHYCPAEGKVVRIEGTVEDVVKGIEDPEQRAHLMRLLGLEEGGGPAHPVAGEETHSGGAKASRRDEAQGGGTERTPKKRRGKRES